MARKIGIILGTRPEIIKLSPVIRELALNKIEYFIIHTGQHYDYLMDKKFFEELDLAPPKYQLNCGNFEYRLQLAKMINEITVILSEEKPETIIVQGDTNTVLAGALSANKVGIAVAHLEAGLRSHDLKMQEEINRIMVDQIADYLFAPTLISKANLIDEGLAQEKIFLTGNTVVDSYLQNIVIAKSKSKILKTLDLVDKKFILATIHRAESVDSLQVLGEIIKGLSLVAEDTSLPIIFPIHPRTKNNLQKFNINPPESIRFIEPLGYLDFLLLETNATLIVTDSGGVQEEACITKTPCVTVRANTERPETLNIGANMLAGIESEKIILCCRQMLKVKTDWPNPFGDGQASKKIVKILFK